MKDASHVLEQISRYSSNETLTFELELAAVGVAGLCAALCLSFTPVVVIFGTLVANIPSMVNAAGTLHDIAQVLDTQTIKGFDKFTADAAIGWYDRSRVDMMLL